ncbi:hypothetical protein IE53DRAFT_263396 [Violaceomyces palustris]|uniref:Uncharacterized protein n=1 Tax=Violaceomyces palustris TaxID=1673888 RepID=A0ACD0P3P7_9BASI|nr:hypothetical protein IE53DRAFT_263396 [Violaceomyces palustris]
MACEVGGRWTPSPSILSTHMLLHALQAYMHGKFSLYICYTTHHALLFFFLFLRGGEGVNACRSLESNL